MTATQLILGVLLLISGIYFLYTIFVAFEALTDKPGRAEQMIDEAIALSAFAALVTVAFIRAMYHKATARKARRRHV